MSTTRSRRASARSSRREEYSESTRAALVDSAITLLTENGYARTSVDGIAAAARVTKGALYHHFPGGKTQLFEAAFDEVEGRVNEQVVVAAARRDATPWESARAGLAAFLDLCLEPTYRRVVWQEGPHVLGFAAWWVHCEKGSLSVILDLLRRLKDAGQIEDLPLEPLARTVSGGLVGAATAMTGAADPHRVRQDFEQVMVRMLVGLRPPDAPDPAPGPGC